MVGNISGVKKIDFPYQLINSNEDVKPAKVSDVVIKGMKNYFSSSNNSYRDRMDNLYQNLSVINPVDNIDDILYTDNYTERGVAIKATPSLLKQSWTEYRLIYNEKKNRKEDETMKFENSISDNKLDLFNLDQMPKFDYNPPSDKINEDNSEGNSLDFMLPDFSKKFEERTPIDNNYLNSESYVLNNFDDIFDRLSKRVDGFSSYLDALKAKKEEINNSKSALETSRQQLENERQEFNRYCEEEKRKLAAEKSQLQDNYQRFQNLVDNLNNKINNIME